MVHEHDSRRRWLALVVVCLGVLMIVLDTTIVNVALASLREELGFSESSLVWVVNAYLLAFCSTLLLAGRLGDLYGHRVVFLAGLALFTIASLACGLAQTQAALIIGRVVQGLGGAVVLTVSLSLITTLFPDPSSRVKATGVYAFVSSGGGSAGLLLGGSITSALDWHWIFLINVPVGVLALAVCSRLLPSAAPVSAARGLDVWGALTVTLSLCLTVYVIGEANALGWLSVPVLAGLLAAAVLLAAFLAWEARAPSPLMPLDIFRQRSLSVAGVVGVLWTAGLCAWSFLVTRYLQVVLEFGPMDVALAFLPTNLIIAVFSLGVSGKLVIRFGVRTPLTLGMAVGTAGLALFWILPPQGPSFSGILPGMLLLGLGAGIALNPLLVAAMQDIPPQRAGLASGIVNTSMMAGGAVGLAFIVSVSSAQAAALMGSGEGDHLAQIGGYRAGFLLASICTGAAAAIGGAFLRTGVAEISGVVSKQTS